jgi:hypothetical protein
MEKMKTPSGEQKLKDEQAAKQAVEKSRRPVPAVSDYQEPDYSLLPKGAHAKLPMIQDSPTPAADESGAQTMRAGDYKGSLERIAREQLGADASQHDINNYVGQLFELNGITDARKIQPDQQIILPDANTAAATKGLKQYGQDINTGNARKYSLPDGWNMRDASAASNAADRASTNTRLVSDMLAGRASEPDNAIGKFKQDALDWIVNQGASTNSSAGQLSAALAYGLVDVFAPEGYGGAALMVGGAALGAGARAVRGLDGAVNLAGGGLRTSATISAERAETFLVKQGVDADLAKSYVKSFDGSITARLVRPGEDFLRYTDRSGSTGNFLTKTQFPDSSTAVESLYLKPFNNNATYVQVVTSNGRTIVLEGRVANGAAQQTLAPNKTLFNYGTGKTYP